MRQRLRGSRSHATGRPWSSRRNSSPRLSTGPEGAWVPGVHSGKHSARPPSAGPSRATGMVTRVRSSPFFGRSLRSAARMIAWSEPGASLAQAKRSTLSAPRARARHRHSARIRQDASARAAASSPPSHGKESHVRSLVPRHQPWAWTLSPLVIPRAARCQRGPVHARSLHGGGGAPAPAGCRRSRRPAPGAARLPLHPWVHRGRPAPPAAGHRPPAGIIAPPERRGCGPAPARAGSSWPPPPRAFPSRNGVPDAVMNSAREGPRQLAWPD